MASLNHAELEPHDGMAKTGRYVTGSGKGRRGPSNCRTIRGMGKRELITRELDRLPERDLDKLLAFLRTINETHSEAAFPALAAETSLAKDWLSPEEDSAWADL